MIRSGKTDVAMPNAGGPGKLGFPCSAARHFQESLRQDDPRGVVRQYAQRELSALRRLAPDVTMAPASAYRPAAQRPIMSGPMRSEVKAPPP